MPTAIPPASDTAIETPIFWVRHKTEVVAAIIVLFVAMLAVAGYQIYENQHQSAAANALGAAKNAGDYQKVIADFPGTGASGSASLLLAEEQRKAGKFAEANTTLQSFVERNPKHELVGTARLAMAGNLESLHKPDEALTIYQRLATDDPRAFTAPLALLSEIHLLKQKNQIAEARRACEAIINQYHDSIAASEATQELRSLKLPEQKAPTPTASATPAAAPAVSPAAR